MDIKQARRNVARRFSEDTICTIHNEPLWDASSQSVERGYVCIKCELGRVAQLEAENKRLSAALAAAESSAIV